MAKAITVTAYLSVSGDGVAFSGNLASLQVTPTGQNAFGNQQTIATSSTALSLGGISSIGFLWIKNTDATNYVEVDSATTFDKFPQKILPGEAILLKPETATIYAKAHTASVIVETVCGEV